MPTYQYECEKCGDIFEIFQKITDDPVKVCPKCGGAVKKLISAGSGIIFKGKGFYQTDYKSSKRDKAAPCGQEGPCSRCDKNG
ncbi:MAG: zinc ribbon domain-containing protein [Candidatus Omnitrophica bacterium]|nr:zinc ribbon domain-containing protein [Candidatus Omnitrophota bacterium]